MSNVICDTILRTLFVPAQNSNDRIFSGGSLPGTCISSALFNRLSHLFLHYAPPTKLNTMDTFESKPRDKPNLSTPSKSPHFMILYKLNSIEC